MLGSEDRQPAGLAEKLDHLIRVRSREQGKALSTNDIAAVINIKAGEPVISGNYIWQLRKGKRDNPTKRHIEALAEYFEVPAAYFHDQPSPAMGRTAVGDAPDCRSGLAEKLDKLLGRPAPPSAGEESFYRSLAADVAARSGEKFSGAYLRKLCHGEQPSPPLRHLCALATYFDVPLAYFTDDTSFTDDASSGETDDEELLARRELEQSMAEAGVSAVYLRGDLAALSPEGKRMAADMIRQIRDLEQGVQNRQPPQRR